jgi:hypothetical protein
LSRSIKRDEKYESQPASPEGYCPDAAAEKKPQYRAFTQAEKRTNYKISRLRIRVEHTLAGVKRSRSVKEVRRSTKNTIADLFMEATLPAPRFHTFSSYL